MNFSPLKLALFHFSNYRELSFKQQIYYPFNEVRDEDKFLRAVPLDKVNTEMKVEYKWKFTKPNSKLHPKKLAEAGFFYSPTRKDKHKDVVTCYMCQCQVDDWATGDDPIQFHSEVAPNCHLVVSKLKFLNEDLNLEEIPFTDEKHFTSRLKTFREWWPHQFKRSSCSPYELAQAGFCLNASTEYPDQTECIHCKLVIKEWKRAQIPFKAHSEASPNCPIVKLILKQSSQRPKPKDLYLPTVPRSVMKLSKVGVKQEEPTAIGIDLTQYSPSSTSSTKKRGRRSIAPNKTVKNKATVDGPNTADRPYSLRSSKKIKLKQEELPTKLLIQTEASTVIQKNKRTNSQSTSASKRQKSGNTPVIKDELNSLIILHSPKNINSSTYFDHQKHVKLTPTISNTPKPDTISEKSLQTVPQAVQASPTVALPNLFNSKNTQNLQPIHNQLVQPVANENQPISNTIDTPNAGLPAPSKISPPLSNCGHKKSPSKNSPVILAHIDPKPQTKQYPKPQSQPTPTSQDQPSKTLPNEVAGFWNNLPPQANLATVVPKGVRLALVQDDRDTLNQLAYFAKKLTLPQMRPTKSLEEFNGTPEQYLEQTKQNAYRILGKQIAHDTLRKENTLEILKNWRNDDKFKKELTRMRDHVEKKQRQKEEKRRREEGKKDT